MKRQQMVEKIKNPAGHGIPKAYLFGSFAREEKKFNNIDIFFSVEDNYGGAGLFLLENSGGCAWGAWGVFCYGEFRILSRSSP